MYVCAGEVEIEENEAMLLRSSELCHGNLATFPPEIQAVVETPQYGEHYDSCQLVLLTIVSHSKVDENSALASGALSRARFDIDCRGCWLGVGVGVGFVLYIEKKTTQSRPVRSSQPSIKAPTGERTVSPLCLRVGLVGVHVANRR